MSKELIFIVIMIVTLLAVICYGLHRIGSNRIKALDKKINRKED